MNQNDTHAEQEIPASAATGDKESAHDFGADYESDYTVPALTRQSHQIESGLMSPHDIPESMPVLRAFHEFLDQERKRTQRRMLILSGVCVGLVIMVILCGILLVVNYGTNARYQYALLERDLSDVRDDATKAKSTAESALGKYSDKTDKLKDMVVSSQQQLLNAQTRSAAAVEQHQRDIDALRRQIELLQATRGGAAPGTPEAAELSRQQDALVRELEKTRAELLLVKAASAQNLARASEQTAPPRRENLVPSVSPLPLPPVPRVVAPVSVTPTAGSTSVQIPIVPRGTDRPVTLRLPIP